MLDIATRIALGPLLLAQASRVRSTALELPEPHGPRSGISGRGDPPLRLLVLGDSSAAGVGARTQHEALAMPLAQRIAERLGRAVRWQLSAESGLTSEGVLHRLIAHQPQPANVAVVVVGVNDIAKQVPLAFALRQRQHIADWLQVHAGVRHVVFPAVPEMDTFPALPRALAFYAGQASRRNNRAQARWAAGQASVSHVVLDGIAHPDLFCEDGFHPAPALYAKVADRLADHIVSVAIESTESNTETS
jgi:lysophospholipase L1-like esterase